MKKIIIKRHAFERIKQRVPKYNNESDFEKFIYKHQNKLFKQNNSVYVKVNMKYYSIPITVVIYKSHTALTIVTAYINEKTKKGKYIQKKVKYERRTSGNNQETK